MRRWAASRAGSCEQLTTDLESLSRLPKASVSPSGGWGGATNKTPSEDFSEAVNLLRLSLLLTDLLTHAKALCYLY